MATFGEARQGSVRLGLGIVRHGLVYIKEGICRRKDSRLKYGGKRVLRSLRGMNIDVLGVELL